MTGEPVRAVLITGTIGSGKTAVASDIGEILASRGRPAAIIDLDWLGWFHDPANQGPGPDELIVRNLAAVWPNFAAAGARYLVMTRAITQGSQIEAIRATLPDAEMKVVALTSTPELIRARLRARDTGDVLTEHLSESVEFARYLDALPFDTRVANDERPIRAVAEELLNRLGWL